MVCIITELKRQCHIISTLTEYENSITTELPTWDKFPKLREKVRGISFFLDCECN